ncbi:expressed unknown protein [Seminavis robusta]|uniref:RING-type domain-containing protein n=1 Tax=Seminavis robusta TaxID=568900 RepID=A0A9N8DDY8_9STRA|nr:expressed unknown protein [Seminavis robusta]|eukprot:Sro74_g040830.1 n/a (690) ;mRNA; r:83531-85880
MTGRHQEVAPFSFHCRICYERLNLTDRPPVVLPCGHTYICQQCSQRLTRCMECRVRIVPVKRPPAQQSNPNTARGYRHRHTQQRHQNYQYPVPTTVDELHNVCKATAGQEDKRPKLPKNVVLMSLLEAAQQKVGSSAMKDDDDDAYESGDDDTLVLEGLRALNSSYGTYVVKAKEGLWVFDGKPSAAHLQQHLQQLQAAKSLSRSNSLSSSDPPGKSPSKENQDPANPLTRRVRSSGDAAKKDRRSSKSRSPIPTAIVTDSDSSLNLSIASGSRLPSSIGKQPSKKAPKAKELLIHGQTVQVVVFGPEFVAQLARGGGYIRVERDDQLVKVGEPADEACRIEGIIFSVLEEKKQYKSRIANLSKLEKTMQSSLRKFYIKEAEELEEKRAKAKLEQLEREKASLHNTSVALSLLEEASDDDQEDDLFRPVNITPPSSPPQLLEVSPDSGLGSPVSPRPSTTRRGQAAAAAATAQADEMVNPQAAPAYHYEMNGTASPRQAGSPPSKDNASPTTTWEEDFFQHGCDMFFCATMPLCVGPTASTAVNDVHGIVGPALQPTASILTGMDAGSHHQQHHFMSHQSPLHHRQHYVFPSLDRNESLDGNGSTLSSGSTVASGAVDFATGLSGHYGISRGGKRRQPIRKKEVRMMSQHDGVAHIRRTQKHSGAASVVSVGGSSKASIATLNLSIAVK